MNFKINSFKVATKLLLFSSSLAAGATSAMPTALYAQQAQSNLKGTVKDEQGNPVVGATIAVKGASVSTSTDSNGAFTLPNVKENDVLVVRMIGYASKEVVYNGGPTLAIQVSADTQNLEEAVVVGYGSLEKREVTSVVTSIKQKDMVAGAVSPLLAIQGKVPGLPMAPIPMPVFLCNCVGLIQSMRRRGHWS